MLEAGGCRFVVIGYRLEVGGRRLLVIGCWLFNTFVFEINNIEAPSFVIILC